MFQRICEMDTGPEMVAAKIRAMKKGMSRPLIVGVAGGSGSGKTSKVAKRIQDLFPGSKILSMDDYFCGQRFMDRVGSNNWDEPQSVELELLGEHLRCLKQGRACRKPIYSFKSGERAGYEKFEPAHLIILEGLFVLYETVVQEIDLKVFVEISVHGSLLRRILRDVGRTGQTEQDIFRQYVETVYPMYKLHIEPTKAQADLVIMNKYLPEAEAENCKARELHIKVPTRGKVPVREIEELGFKRASMVQQEDIYYAAPGWVLPYSDELMRVRREQGKYILAYKGPVSGGLFGIKQKIEFEVESSLKDGLESLGYRRILSLKKQREKLIGRELELAIDCFEDGSNFLEFRTSEPQGEARILICLEELGIDKESVTKKSYLDIWLSRISP